MKKALMVVLCLTFGLCLIVGCGPKEAEKPAAQTQQEQPAQVSSTPAPESSANTQPAQDTTSSPSNVNAATPTQP